MSRYVRDGRRHGAPAGKDAGVTRTGEGQGPRGCAGAERLKEALA
ncbi:hypothetical protein ACH4F6_11910 [Streptomyces sp. NPDC017936]